VAEMSPEHVGFRDSCCFGKACIVTFDRMNWRVREIRNSKQISNRKK